MTTKKKRIFNDFGLGSKASSGSYRSVNKDGSFNVKKTNIPFFEGINFFHSLISMSWLNFFGFVLLGYLFINTLFASLYLIVGVENLTGIEAKSITDQFIEAFFFSAQTITTLGYGRVAPTSILANIIAAIESMLGLLTFALATGLLYGRFSKPSAKIKYSSLGVIAPYENINGFMFRVVNPQNNQLMEVEVNVSLSIQQKNSPSRNFQLLELERSKVFFLPSVWTIVHPINEKSPLYKMSEKELIEMDAEFIIVIKAFDESFSQTVYSRNSYKASELKWGEKFSYIVNREETGITIDVSRLDETQKMPLN